MLRKKIRKTSLTFEKPIVRVLLEDLGTAFSRREAIRFLVEEGFSWQSADYFLKKLREDGFLTIKGSNLSITTAGVLAVQKVQGSIDLETLDMDILHFLTGNRPASVSDIQRSVNRKSRDKIHRALKRLLNRELVVCKNDYSWRRRDPRWRFYAISEKGAEIAKKIGKTGIALDIARVIPPPRWIDLNSISSTTSTESSSYLKESRLLLKKRQERLSPKDMKVKLYGYKWLSPWMIANALERLSGGSIDSQNCLTSKEVLDGIMEEEPHVALVSWESKSQFPSEVFRKTILIGHIRLPSAYQILNNPNVEKESTGVVGTTLREKKLIRRFAKGERQTFAGYEDMMGAAGDNAIKYFPGKEPLPSVLKLSNQTFRPLITARTTLAVLVRRSFAEEKTNPVLSLALQIQQAIRLTQQPFIRAQQIWAYLTENPLKSILSPAFDLRKII